MGFPAHRIHDRVPEEFRHDHAEVEKEHGVHHGAPGGADAFGPGVEIMGEVPAGFGQVARTFAGIDKAELEGGGNALIVSAHAFGEAHALIEATLDATQELAAGAGGMLAQQHGDALVHGEARPQQLGQFPIQPRFVLRIHADARNVAGQATRGESKLARRTTWRTLARSWRSLLKTNTCTTFDGWRRRSTKPSAGWA